MKALPFALAALPLLAAQEKLPAKSIRASRASAAICLDGRLQEADWSRAEAARDFTTQWPDLGKPAPLATEARVLYDDHYLYIGARMHHPPGRARVIRRLHRRDQDSHSDWFSVYLDTMHDRRTAFAFQVNAAGVQRDQVVYADTTQDASWDGVWESAVHVDEDGWSAELKLPLSLLRIRDTEGPQTWGINFGRVDQGPVRGSSYWDQAPRGVNAFVSRFPLLTGIEGLKPHPRREWIPYASLQRKFETARPYDDRGWTPRVGLDAHLGLTPTSQLDLTARPDFGQVEVDEVVLNLGTLETYYPEKRPFFLEGMEIFQVAGPRLFYSRRIGRGLGDPSLKDGEALVDRPAAAEILGAAKYTAKFDSGLNLGALGAVVEPAHATLREMDGRERKQELSPQTGYAVLRAQQTLGRQGSYVGAFASAMRQAGPLGRTAQVQALDTVLKSPGLGTTLEASLARSQEGVRDHQNQGWRGRFRLHQSWSGGLTLELSGANAGRDYNPNDLGFLERADERSLYFGTTRTWDRSWGVFRNWKATFYAGDSRDQSGRAYSRYAESSFSTDTQGFYALWCGAGANLPVDDDRELRTFRDPAKKYLHRDRIPYAWAGADTPGNRPWYGRLQVTRDWQEGGSSTNTTLYQAIKVNASVEIQLNTALTDAAGERKYFRTPEDGQPIVGLRRLRSFNQTLRLAYAVSPTFSVQAFSQWFAANYAYRDLKAWVDDRTLRPATGEQPLTAASLRTWTVNLITRWEFRPGSTAFLVYTHGAETDALVNDRATLSPRGDLALLNHLPSDDAVQLKLSWMFR